MAVLFAVLMWMASLAPGRSHIENATAITRVVLAERPLFAGDEDRRKTAALVVAVAFRESSLRNDVKSKTDDHCMMQVNRRPDLALDAEKCVRHALGMLRASMAHCPAFPLATYAAGPVGCTNDRAQRISRDRMSLARSLVKQ